MPQLAQIIEFTDPVGDVLATRLPASGDGVIEWGSQLIVREGQVALFLRDGKAMEVFSPGRYVLTTQNVPGLTKLVTGLAYGSGNTPFRAEVYFVSLGLFRDLRWGTPEPVYIPDPVMMQIPIRGNGRFAIRVADPTIFVPKLVGTRPALRTADVEEFLRSQYLVSALTDACASLAKPFNELPRYYRELGIGVKSLLAPEFGTLGLELAELSVNSVSTTEEVQAMFSGNAKIASEAFARARGTQYDLEAKAAGAAALGQAGTTYREVGLTDAMRAMAEKPAGAGEGGGGAAAAAAQQGVNLGLSMMMPGMMADMMRQTLGTGGVAAGAAPTSAGTVPADPKPDPFEQIRRLKELLDLGAISQAEFDAKKAEWLKQM